MVTLDRIRLTGLLRKPLRRGGFYFQPGLVGAACCSSTRGGYGVSMTLTLTFLCPCTKLFVALRVGVGVKPAVHR